MQGTYDRTYSLGHSSSNAFQKAQKHILRLIKHRAKVNKLNRLYLNKTNDFPKKTSIIVRKTLCSQCPEDQELCEEGRDDRRRYYCKVLSQRTGEYVRLYLSSEEDLDYRKERLKQRIMQTVARNRGASQTLISKIVRGDKRIVRDCLNELTARGLLRCLEQKERNCLVKRYVIVFD